MIFGKRVCGNSGNELTIIFNLKTWGQRPESDLNSSPNHKAFIGRLTDVSLAGNGNENKWQVKMHKLYYMRGC